MCYAIPAKIIEIQGHKAVIDYFGEHRNILLDLSNVKVGDYIYAQGGISVSKVSEQEAKEILETWKEIFFELKKTDEALSKVHEENLPSNVLNVLQQVNLRKSIKKQELLALFQLQKPQELSVLYEIANNVRHREHGNASCVHGILEFSNYCDQNCFYCGIRKDKNIKRYRMSEDEIIAAAKQAVDKYGFKALVLQSGEDLWYTDEKLETIVREVRKLGVLVFLSIGSRSIETYQKLYQAGARAVLLRFETSNEKIFETLRPENTLRDRIELIKQIKQLGYVLATGFLMGLPNETSEDLVNNILLTKSLGPDMFSFGPLIPTTETPLADQTKITKDLLLKTIAITRFVDADSNILVTTAMETLDPDIKKQALMAGGNSLMINMTPKKYRTLYKIYDDRIDQQKTMDQCVQEVVDLLYSLGRAPTDLGTVPVGDCP